MSLRESSLLNTLNISLTIKLSSPKAERLEGQAIQDISAGGTSIPGCEPGYIALWATNFAGQVNN